ncbi:hypothetical protein G6F56_012419 [Rhizopus delemar]|nr:hypothetical protein G6F56_012419 [Rhizopus delemar]
MRLLKRLMEGADEVDTDTDIDEQYSNLREKTRAFFEDIERAQEAAMNDMGSTRRLHSDATTHPPKYAPYYPVAGSSSLSQPSVTILPPASSPTPSDQSNNERNKDDSIEAEFVARARTIARSHNDDCMNDIISSANSSGSGHCSAKWTLNIL